MTPPLLKYRDVAQRLGVTERTVKNWRKNRTIDAIEIGGSVRFSEEGIQRAMTIVRRKKL